MTKTRSTVLAAALAVLVGAAPAVACLATAHEAPVVEHAPTGCDPSPAAPSATLCPDSGMVIPADGPAAPIVGATGLDAASHPGEVRPPDFAAGPAHVTPTARSAPIHLLHAIFLI